MTLKVLAPGGDGIGPEVVDASLRVLDVAADSIGLDVDLADNLFGEPRTSEMSDAITEQFRLL